MYLATAVSGTLLQFLLEERVAKGVGGYYVAVGFSGHGFKLCPAVGEMVADLMIHGKKAGSDIDNFRSTRFEEEKPIVPKYA